MVSWERMSALHFMDGLHENENIHPELYFQKKPTLLRSCFFVHIKRHDSVWLESYPSSQISCT